MRKLFALTGFLILISFTKTETPLSKKDRKFALGYLKETKQRLFDNMKNLSDEQLNWRPADSIWSIANCIEHIAISEKKLFEWAIVSLQVAANPAKRTEIKQTDEAIMKMIIDRGFRAKAPVELRPTGQMGSGREALKTFIEQRDHTIGFFKKTKEDLRNHFVAHPFLGTIDTYQLLLFMTGHTLRHTLQVEEIKGNSGFPGN